MEEDYKFEAGRWSYRGGPAVAQRGDTKRAEQVAKQRAASAWRDQRHRTGPVDEELPADAEGPIQE